MRPLSRLALPLLALLFAGCATMEINTAYDPGAAQKLDSFRSYAWLDEPAGKDPRINNAVVAGLVRQAVDQDLQSRGYRKVDASANPDFLIGWQGAIDQKLEADTVNAYYGYPWDPVWDPFWGPAVAAVPETYVRQYDEGTLILDIVDAGTKKLVWRGTAQSEVSGRGSAEKNQKKVEEAVTKMLADFPPGPTKK